MSDEIDTIAALQNEVDTLKRKLREAEAFQVHQLHFAADTLKKFAVDRIAGSAVILEVSSVGGKTVLGPVAVNGFSADTIAALTADLRRTYQDRTEFKP